MIKKIVLIDLQALKVYKKNIALKNSAFSSFHKLIWIKWSQTKFSGLKNNIKHQNQINYTHSK